MVLADLAEFTHFVTRVKIVPAVADDVSLAETERTRGRAFAEKLSMRVLVARLADAAQGHCRGRGAGRPLAAAEMVLVRIAYAADLPTPDEVIRSLDGETRGEPAPRAGNGGGRGACRARRRASRAPRYGCAARRAARGAGAGDAAGRRSGRAQRAEPSRAALVIGRFEDLIALAAQKRDLAVKLALERDVRLVRCEDGRLEIALEKSAAKTLVNELVAQVLAMDRPALDGRGLGRAGAADRQGAERGARRPSSRPACAPIRWCRRCWRAFPAPRSSTCASPTRRRCRPASRTIEPRRRYRRRRMTARPTAPTGATTTTIRGAVKMADFLGMMKQAAELKSKMEAMQAELDQVEVEGTSGGGLVRVTLSGKGEMKGVKIDETLIKPDREGDRRGLDRRRPCRRAPQGRGGHAGEDAGLTGGLPLPPG